MIVCSDNQAAISILHHPEFCACTKHMDIDMHFLHDHIQQGTIKLEYVPSSANLANIFTKALPKPVHCQITSLISHIPGQEGVLDESAQTWCHSMWHYSRDLGTGMLFCSILQTAHPHRHCIVPDLYINCVEYIWITLSVVSLAFPHLTAAQFINRYGTCGYMDLLDPNQYPYLQGYRFPQVWIYLYPCHSLLASSWVKCESCLPLFVPFQHHTHSLTFPSFCFCFSMPSLPIFSIYFSLYLVFTSSLFNNILLLGFNTGLGQTGDLPV